MKYYIAATGKIENGPGGKPLSIVASKKEVTEDEFNKTIDEFFSEATATNKEEALTQVWDYLQKGTPVTLESKTLSIKK